MRNKILVRNIFTLEQQIWRSTAASTIGQKILFVAIRIRWESSLFKDGPKDQWPQDKLECLRASRFRCYSIYQLLNSFLLLSYIFMQLKKPQNKSFITVLVFKMRAKIIYFKYGVWILCVIKGLKNYVSLG